MNQWKGFSDEELRNLRQGGQMAAGRRSVGPWTVGEGTRAGGQRTLSAGPTKNWNQGPRPARARKTVSSRGEGLQCGVGLMSSPPAFDMSRDAFFHAPVTSSSIPHGSKQSASDEISTWTKGADVSKNKVKQSQNSCADQNPKPSEVGVTIPVRYKEEPALAGTTTEAAATNSEQSPDSTVTLTDRYTCNYFRIKRFVKLWCL